MQTQNAVLQVEHPFNLAGVVIIVAAAAALAVPIYRCCKGSWRVWLTAAVNAGSLQVVSCAAAADRWSFCFAGSQESYSSQAEIASQGTLLKRHLWPFPNHCPKAAPSFLLHFLFPSLLQFLRMAWRASVGTVFRSLKFTFNEASSSAWGVAGFIESNHYHLKAHNPNLPVRLCI